MLLKRLLKWLGIAVLVLVVAVLIVVWPVLGVNPFEGRIDHLWLLTSNEVQFFVRFPSINVIEEEELFENLEREAPYTFFADFKNALVEATAEVAREVNPQIPMGLVEVDLEQDFFGQEMALAGSIQGDYRNPRLDQFIFLTRVEFYARFVSALKREFVRDRIRGINVELVRGLYFRLQVSPQVANVLRPFRSKKGSPAGDTTFYLARIGDVVLFSDNDRWIEDALQGNRVTLQADAWFESEFIGRYRGGNRMEAFVRPALTVPLLTQHARGGGVAQFLRGVLPPRSMGELVLSFSPRGKNELEFSLANALATEGFGRMPAYLQAIYDEEKGDPRYDLSPEGLARFIPRERVVAGIVLHARPEDLAYLIEDMMPPAMRDEADQQVRKVARERGQRFTSFRSFLEDLTQDLGNDHLIVLHRPSIFEGQRYIDYEEETWPPLPLADFHYSLVASVKDSVRPDKVREKFFRSLQYMGLNSAGPHKSGQFHLATLMVSTGDESLIQPAYGAMGGGKRFLVVSSSVEAAEAIYEAAENADARMITRPGIEGLASRLPPRATVSLLVDGANLREALFDRVRIYAGQQMQLEGVGGRLASFRQRNQAKFSGKEEELDRAVEEYKAKVIAEEWPKLRERYSRIISFLTPVDAAAASLGLGMGSERSVVGGGNVRFVVLSE